VVELGLNDVDVADGWPPTPDATGTPHLVFLS
jgi:hypothetical protein